jgi:3'-phosphoadenosine 5'-phosphosulfate sulfotransferase (PAPS reductase)/FAD synthetase
MAKRKSSVDVVAGERAMVAIDSIRPHPRNPRQGDVGAIVESIKANGFYAPCIVQQSSGRILAGNHRWLAARELGMAEVPVIWVDCDDDRALRILLADNRTSDLAAYDDNKLAELLQEIQAETGDLLGTGFDGDALDALLADLGLTGNDEPEPERFKPETLKGAGIAALAPTEEEREILTGRKLLVEYSGGKDSSAAAVWARHYFPDNPTELLFVDLAADFVGFHIYLHDAAKFLGVPLVILRSQQTVFQAMLDTGYWPVFMGPYCHNILHQPLDDYIRKHELGSVAILRGGRASERALKKGPSLTYGEIEKTRFLTVKGMEDYTYFQPLYFSDKHSSVKLLEEAGLPIWDGYSRGLCRTACRICPGQKARAYSAIRANFPDVWAELLDLERRFGAGCWTEGNDGGRGRFEELADRGQEAFEQDTAALTTTE